MYRSIAAIVLVTVGLLLAFSALALGDTEITAGDAGLAILGVLLAAVGLRRDARALGSGRKGRPLA